MALTTDQKETLQTAFDAWRKCHSLHPGENAKAPTLSQVFGSRVGSTGFARYSRALRQYDGLWTKEALTTFFKKPQELIPGTTMPNPNVDNEVVDNIVSLLEHLTHTIETNPIPK